MDVLEAAIQGDKGAFTALLAQHYDFIFSVAWRWCANREDAEDVTQDVCMRLARCVSSFRKTAQFRTWLYTITLNAVRDLKRRQLREHTKRAEWARERPLHEQADDGAVDELWALVRQLPENLSDAVLLVHGEGLNHAQAAKVLGCKESTISWRLMEARKMLKTFALTEVA